MAHCIKIFSFGVIIVIFGLTSSWANTTVLEDNINELVSEIERRFCTEAACFFPEKTIADDDITITKEIRWNQKKKLVLHTKRNIIFKEHGSIVADKEDTVVILKAGMETGSKIDTEKVGKIKFEGDGPQVHLSKNGKLKVHYNPDIGEEKHKYHNPRYFGDAANNPSSVEAYMLVNTIEDLQAITGFLSGNYALSRDIDAQVTSRWDHGSGFKPIMSGDRPFAGNFDGNGYVIRNLFIRRPNEEYVGLFGFSSGLNGHHNDISNFSLEDAIITGGKYVGGIIGVATTTKLNDVTVKNSTIKSKNSKTEGATIGSCLDSIIINLRVIDSGDKFVGAAAKSIFINFFVSAINGEGKSISVPSMGYDGGENEFCLPIMERQFSLNYKSEDNEFCLPGSNYTPSLVSKRANKFCLSGTNRNISLNYDGIKHLFCLVELK